MRIQALTGFPTSYVVWHSERNGRMCTVIVKGTYAFANDRVAVADRQEPIHTGSVPSQWGDPVGSALATSDLAPFKRRADVVLVWAPRPASGPTGSRPRITVGDIDKPLSLDAPTLPPRSHLRSPSVNPFEHPEEVDPTYFNVAPPDQQLAELASDSVVVLEGLYPGRDRVVLNLPGHVARGLFDSGNFELTFHCDTLWIDVDRSICTLTWRANYRIDSVAADDRILVGLDLRDELRSRHEMRDAANGVKRASAADDGATPAQHPSPEMTAEMSVMASVRVTAASSPAPAAAPSRPPQPSLAQAPLPTQETIEFPMPSFVDPETVTPFQNHGPLPARHQPPAPATQPVGSSVASSGFTPRVGLAARAPDARFVPPPARLPESPPPSVPAAPAPVPSTWGLGRGLAALHTEPRASTPGTLAHDKAAASRGVAGVSDAAADSAREKPPKRAPAPAKPTATTSPTTFVDLLWFDPTVHERIHAHATWNDRVKGDPVTRKWLRQSEASEASQAAVPPTRTVGRALTRVVPIDSHGIAEAMINAIDEDGLLVRPIVLVEGEMSVSLDRLEFLKATLAFADPVARTDKKLKEACDAGAEIAAGDARVVSAQYDAAVQRVRAAFQAVNKAYPANYLEKGVERALLEARAYATRLILGATRLVAQIEVRQGEVLTLYLPAELRDRLPLVPRCRVRVIAEPHAQQSLADGDDMVLVALAVARVVPRPSGAKATASTP